MGALNAAPGQNPFAIELQNELWHPKHGAARLRGCVGL